MDDRRLAKSMKGLLKNTLGLTAISLAEAFPFARTRLRNLGLRCSPGRFGNRVVTLRSPSGRPVRLARIDDCYLALQLFWRGVSYYEPLTRTLLEAVIRPGDTFLDLGAHLGFFSLAVGLGQPGLRIVAFEPNPKNFRVLLANFEANNLTHVVCEPLAISDREGSALLYLTESDMSASLQKGFQEQDTLQVGSIEVRTTSLDGYARAHGLGGRMLIKVDIEGHEAAFFRGAAQTIAACKPDLILEVLGEQDAEILAWLKSLGYRFYPITDEGLIEVDEPRLIKRFPLLFLNYLLSARPLAELAGPFECVRAAAASLDLLETSKHFPPAEWPGLWSSSELPPKDPIERAAEAKPAPAD
jgi:FkbM family methyltransferase